MTVLPPALGAMADQNCAHRTGDLEAHRAAKTAPLPGFFF
jgi:hypothetical protein